MLPEPGSRYCLDAPLIAKLIKLLIILFAPSPNYNRIVIIIVIDQPKPQHQRHNQKQRGKC